MDVEYSTVISPNDHITDSDALLMAPMGIERTRPIL
jgi:hypothetical protein